MRSVLLVGDSHLAKMTKPYVGEMETLLRNDGSDIGVLNCAMGGSDSADFRRWAPVLARMPVTAAIISVGTNDFAPWKQIPVSVFMANLRAGIGAFSGARVVVLTPPPVDEQAQPGPRRRTNADVAAYSDAVQTVCADLGASCLDTTAVLREVRGRGLPAHAAGGVHLSGDAYQLLVAAIGHTLNEYPEQEDRPSRKSTARG